MPSASSGAASGTIENDEESKRRRFQEQRSSMDREEMSASLAWKRARADEDEERVMDTLALNLSRLGCGSLWHIHGALDGWTEARQEIRDTRHLMGPRLLECASDDLKDSKLVLAGLAHDIDCPDSRATVDLCCRARESRIPFVMHVPGGHDVKTLSRLTASDDVSVMNLDSVVYVTNWEKLKEKTDISVCALSDRAHLLGMDLEDIRRHMMNCVRM
eukprot:6490611-Amphidinium_carterae.2